MTGAGGNSGTSGGAPSAGSGTGASGGMAHTGGTSAAAGGAPNGGNGASAGTTGGVANTAGNSASGGAASGAGGATAMGGATNVGGAAGASSGRFVCPAGPFGAPLPANTKFTQIAGVPPPGFGTSSTSNVEGPVWIGDTLYVSHIQEGVSNPPPSRILSITGTTVKELLNPSGSNGLAVNAAGQLVAARHSDGSVAVFDFTKNAFISPPLAAMYQGQRFDSPNDLAVRSDGNVYFSDPDYQAPTPHPQAKTGLYRVSPSGTVSLIDDTINEPNGVTLSPDEATLYVSSTTSGVKSFPVAMDGSVGAGTSFSSTTSDGMAIDCAGNLYLSNGQGFVILGPDGKNVGSVTNAVTSDATTNLAFGGSDHKRLFVTGRGNNAGLWYADLAVPGMPY